MDIQPICMLPLLLKTVESFFQDQAFKSLKDGSIFYKCLSGFRNNHLTNLFVTFFNNEILKSFLADCIVMFLIDL